MLLQQDLEKIRLKELIKSEWKTSYYKWSINNNLVTIEKKYLKKRTFALCL